MNSKQEVIHSFNKEKKVKLLICILIDVIGKITFFIPGANVIWGPISGLLIYGVFGGFKGVIGGITGFAEEVFPGTDFIPTATAMWVYVYLIRKDKTLESYLRSKTKEEEVVTNFLNDRKRK